MTRKSLCRDIQSVHQRLNLRQQQFQLTHEQSKNALKNINPYFLIGGGLCAGIITSVIGLSKVYTVVSASYSVYPFLMKNGRRLMSVYDKS